jgi:lysophospholipase L1-like esterase
MSGNPKHRSGVLAFGDSITNGGGELQWGVALQSWALWLARGLGLPYTGYAFDGARTADVVRIEIPAFLAGAADPDAHYDVGCLYSGVNDVSAPEWDATAFAADYETALEFLGAHCDRVLAVTAPLGLGLPRAGAGKVRQMNGAIERLAAGHGALVVDLSEFGARNLVMADRVHPTAFGQIEIAERALAVLAGDGLPTRVEPASLIQYETVRWRRLQADLTYVYRSVRQLGIYGLRRMTAPRTSVARREAASASTRAPGRETTTAPLTKTP